MFKMVIGWFGLMGVAVSVLGASPAVVWVSQPVEPGEAVMVYGGPWTNVTAVELAGPKKLTVAPLLVTDDCLTFVYPSGWPRAAFTARLVTDGGTVEVRINAPDVWWLQGDAGKSASPGGWLRAFGRCIGYDKHAFLEFRGASAPRKVPATQSDLYALRAELPKDLPPGEYEVFLNNGLDKNTVSAGKLKVAPFKEPWQEKVFSVADYGAVPNDGNDDSRAILAALAAIATNGGGVLYFPKGPMLEAGKWHHVVAQFVPPDCRISVDGKPVLQYQDPGFLPNLDRIGLYSNGHRFDNVRIYAAAKLD